VLWNRGGRVLAPYPRTFSQNRRRHILKEYCRPADLAAASPIFLFVGAGFIGGEAAAFGISSFPPDLKVTSMNLQSRA
jgi:hypothetical protein